MLSFLGPSSRLWLAAALVVAAAPLVCAAPAQAQISGGTMVARYADALGTANGRLPAAVRRDLAERLLLLSSYYKIDPCLLAALVTVESAWRERAVSPVGALGYGQLMPGTAAGLRVDALEPYENLDGTARYLRRMLNRYAGRDAQTRMQLALASYNAGAGAVDRYHGIPPYSETRAYVANVLRTRRTFVASVGMRASADIASLLTHPAATRKARATRHLTLAAASKRPHRPRSSYVATEPQRVALETPPPARYETSRSFVARFLGLRHRVAGPSVPPPATGAAAGPAGDY